MFKKAIKKSSVLITALIILALSAVGGTAAYLITSDVGENQIFEKPVIRCEVVDTLQQGSSIVRNTGNVDVYIRVAIVANWKDADGNVYAFSPKHNTDYTLTLGQSGWFMGSDGYYYYNNILGAGLDTTALIADCRLLSATPEGYSFSLELLADAIQSSPANAVVENWNVTVQNDGTISK